MRKAKVGLQRARDHVHGQYIYAYCNVRTNQVLYSLNRNLQNNSVLRQLPDLGANNAPRALRKDLWQPLYTLTLPPTDEGRKQGLHAYKKLREWRVLHETSWQPSALLSKPFSEAEREKLQRKLDARGGSKKENVYDLIKRAKKKMRVNEVQNQKANSIADLAAVLVEQEELGALTSEQRDAEQRRDREREVKEMLALAQEADDRGLATLGAEITELSEAIERAEKTGEAVSKSRTRREIHALKAKQQKMEFAQNAVAIAREESASASKPASAGSLQSDATTAEQLAAYLPSFPQRDPTTIPKRGWLRAKLERDSGPIYSTAGVTIKWQNILDAEFAPAWPENVTHEILGFSRHTAPRADVDAQTDISDFKAAQWRKRAANWVQQPTDGEAQEGEVEPEAQVDAGAAAMARAEESRQAQLKAVQGEVMSKVQAMMAKDGLFQRDLKRLGLVDKVAEPEQPSV